VIKLKKMRDTLAGLACGLAASACAISFAVANEADSVPVLFKGIAHDALYAVCIEGKEGLAVGAAGTLVESGDGGLSWNKAAQPITDLALLGLSCRGGRVVAVGQGGALFVRKDGQWKKVSSGTEQRLLSIDTHPSGLAVAVGGFGTVLLSKDGGETWAAAGIDWLTVVDDGSEPHMYDVSISEAGVITLVGEYELVLRSEDGGASWTTVHKGESSLFGLHFRDASNGFAVGQEGKVLKTVDGGLTWVPMAASSNANLLDVWSSPKGQVVVSGIRALLRSSDDGATWQSVEAGDIPIGWYQGVAGVDLADGAGQNVVMVGRAGQIRQVK
jgi:photosystem II stability/assembly factor-like uncharacterized protein